MGVCLAAVMGCSGCTGDVSQVVVSDKALEEICLNHVPPRDVGDVPTVRIKSELVFAVPPSLQEEALDVLNTRYAVKLDRAQAEHFMPKVARPDLTPYLIKSCIYGVVYSTQAPGHPTQDDLNFFMSLSRAYYTPNLGLLSILSNHGAVRGLTLDPVAIVVWNKGPIRQVENTATYFK